MKLTNRISISILGYDDEEETKEIEKNIKHKLGFETKKADLGLND